MPKTFDGFIFGGVAPFVTPRGILWVELAVMAAWFAAIIFAVYKVKGGTKGKKDESRVDSYAASMGYGKAIKGLLEETAGKKAKRLLKTDQPVQPGIRLGKLVKDNRTVVWSDWEAEMLILAGPRSGKTTGYVIPAILYAPGACFATANKRDIVDSTRAILEKKGKNIWLFDPERIASGKPTWYWDPIKSIRNLEDAKRIADCWRASAGLNNSDGNSEFFNGGAATQLASYLFAASLENATIQDVFKWCQDEKNDTAARILDKYGYSVIANAVYGVIGITPETRSGIYAGLKKMVDFVVDDKLIPWIQRMGPDDDRPSFDPFDFALSNDMMYLLSQKGTRSTPITAALTAVTSRAGYEISQEMGGRLPMPLLGVLDEAANVCPWPELPEIYSYYGSCGVILMTFFQNMAQGVLAFNEEGFNSLFNNANTFIYLGGNKDDKFLGQLSTLIGQRDVMQTNVSDSQGFTSGESRSLRQEKILTEQQLAEWPEFRGLVLSSQNRSTIVKTIPFFLDPVLAPQVEESNKIAKQQVADDFSLAELKKGAKAKFEEANAPEAPPAPPAGVAPPAPQQVQPPVNVAPQQAPPATPVTPPPANPPAQPVGSTASVPSPSEPPASPQYAPTPVQSAPPVAPVVPPAPPQQTPRNVPDSLDSMVSLAEEKRAPNTPNVAQMERIEQIHAEESKERKPLDKESYLAQLRKRREQEGGANE
jgi:type IV secretory pathway TraG/TraD family ATPase VirD4